MQRRKAIYSVSIDGKDVSSGFVAVLTKITIKDAAGQNSDTASIELDDRGGQISLPRVGAKITIGLGWEGGKPVVVFEGVVDGVTSTGGRGQGRMLTVSAKSADPRKKLKSKTQKHKDKAKLGDVAKEWGKDAGLTDVKVHADIEKIERQYWSMDGESFLQWGRRVAREVGATFKVMGDRAVITPRSAGQTASGKPLPKITGRWGVNLISWSISPVTSRPAFRKFEKRYYDTTEAKWKTETFDAREVADGIDATEATTFSEADKDGAKTSAEASEKEADRNKGDGSAKIDGDASAQAEAEFELIGTRPGVDGTYRIESLTHTYERSGGWTTDLDLKQPKGEAGKDKRASEKASGASSAPALGTASPAGDVNNADRN